MKVYLNRKVLLFTDASNPRLGHESVFYLREIDLPFVPFVGLEICDSTTEGLNEYRITHVSYDTSTASFECGSEGYDKETKDWTRSEIEEYMARDGFSRYEKAITQ